MVCGKAPPKTFPNAATGTRCVVHGTSVGQRNGLVRDTGTRRHAKWSKRRQRHIVAQQCKSDSTEEEADSNQLVMEHFGLEELSNVLTARAKKKDVGEEGELTKEESMGYRRVAARANYLDGRPGRHPSSR